MRIFQWNVLQFRVRLGGHFIPEETIRRRHKAGIHNFFALYRPLADSWSVHDTTKIGFPAEIARGRMDEIDEINDAQSWNTIRGMVNDG